MKAVPTVIHLAPLFGARVLILCRSAHTPITLALFLGRHENRDRCSITFCQYLRLPMVIDTLGGVMETVAALVSDVFSCQYN